jgi:multiple sugar transport system permease protein
MPRVVTVLLFAFVAAWNNYFLPLVVLSDEQLYPLTVGLALLQGRIGNNPAEANFSR